MKKISILMAALLVAMTGCQKEPQVTPENKTEGNVYMTFSVKAVTKSSTDNTGDSNSNATPEIEVGKDEENAISNIQVFLQNGGNTIEATNVTLVGGGVNYTATFKEEQLVAGIPYSIYVICNETADVVNPDAATAEKTITGWTGTELNISKDNNFLMTNAKTVEPRTITETELNACMNPATPLNLGLVEVERTVARFDYAQTKDAHLYPIAGNTVKIYLSEAAVINVSKGSYYFRRVADENGTPFVIGGDEVNTNYVVDTDWAAKTTLYGAWSNVEAVNLFHSPLFNKETWEWVNLTTLADQDKINDPINGKQYNFLSYVSENTIPGKEAQINGLSTGVVFRGYLHNGSDVISGTENLYVYANKYYGTWAEVSTAAQTDATLLAAYNAVNGSETDLAKCVNAGFTVYTPVDGKYPVYYYYWNRHNDNLESGKMGNMEFAVVRNNVYKLAVTNINQFGHPELPEGDPDPVTPQTPDEQVRHYFQVTVKVLPWTVRVNDIEF